MHLFIENIKWITLLLLFSGAGLVAANFDIKKTALVGDQASHTMQALSIANDLDLKFDSNDEKSWLKMGWKANPDGLLFQKYSEGYSFAKPYAYSLFTSVFVMAFDTKGLIVGNVCIFILLNIFIYLTLIKYYSESISIGLTGAFSFFSYVYMYTFTIHTDLFLAMLVAIVVYIISTLFEENRRKFFLLLPILLAFLIVDKITMLLIFSPMLIYLLLEWPRKDRIVFVGFFVLSYILFSSPYLYYSDFVTWNAYSGERYYSISSVPFFENFERSGYVDASKSHRFSISFILDNVFNLSGSGNKSVSLYLYFFGAYTGILAFAPLAFLVVFFSTYRTIVDFNTRIALVLAGLFLYISFYIVLFTSNYYGGYQSLGNRYFLQVSPVIILLLLLLKLNRLQSLSFIALSLLLTAFFLHHQHTQPQRAYSDIMSTSTLQSMLPFDRTQKFVVQYYPNNQKINLGLLPGRATFYKPDNRSFVYNKGDDALTSYNETYIDADIPFFNEITLNQIDIFVDNGFYHSEETHIWSQKKSTIIVKNSGQTLHLVISTFPASNKLDISIDNSVYEYDLTPKESQIVKIDLHEIQGNWLTIEFEADNSLKPSQRNRQDIDNRNLSFAISLY